jgi:hypothetical protein
MCPPTVDDVAGLPDADTRCEHEENKLRQVSLPRRLESRIEASIDR